MLYLLVLVYIQYICCKKLQKWKPESWLWIVCVGLLLLHSPFPESEKCTFLSISPPALVWGGGGLFCNRKNICHICHPSVTLTYAMWLKGKTVSVFCRDRLSTSIQYFLYSTVHKKVPSKFTGKLYKNTCLNDCILPYTNNYSSW